MQFTDEQVEALTGAAEELWPTQRSNTRDLITLIPDILERAEMMAVPQTASAKGDAEPNLKPGQIWRRHDGTNYLRVKVLAGRGAYAFWHRQQPKGELAEYQVIADMTDNPQSSHRAGAFSEPFEGKPGHLGWLKVNA